MTDDINRARSTAFSGKRGTNPASCVDSTWLALSPEVAEIQVEARPKKHTSREGWSSATSSCLRGPW